MNEGERNSSTRQRRAKDDKPEMHGTLWVVDQLELTGDCPINALHSGLTKALTHPRCRLPKAEVQRRLHRYAL